MAPTDLAHMIPTNSSITQVDYIDQEAHLPPRATKDEPIPPTVEPPIAQLWLRSWAWSLMPATSLGLSTLLNAQRSLYNFHGLYTIGTVVYFIGLVQYVLVGALKAKRFIRKRRSFRASLKEPSEAMFFAAFWISTYGVITGGVDLAQPAPGSRLATTFMVFFWIYLVCALCAGVSLHLLLFHEHRLKSRDMTPAWLLPVLPIILIGVMGGSVGSYLTSTQRYPVLIAGFICSSMGFLVSLPLAALYLGRLFTTGLPDPDARPGMMIAIGPPTFAPLAWLKIAMAMPKDYGIFATTPIAADVVSIVSLCMALGVYGLGLFFAMMAIFPILRRARVMRFHLTWYGLVFPNVGLLSCLGLFGTLFPSDAVKWVASILTAVAVGVWLFVSCMHIWVACQAYRGVRRERKGG